MKKQTTRTNIKGLFLTMGYALLTGIAALGSSLLLAGLLFGRSGINDQMVDVTNFLMGVLGTPIVVWLTHKYYRKYAVQAASEVDFLHVKKLPAGVLSGFLLPLLLLAVLLLAGGSFAYQGIVINAFSLISGVATFVGMAALEECIFRGLLRQAFGRFNKTAGNLLPIVLFAALHMDLWQHFSWLRVLDLVLAGFLFTVILEKSGSLLFTTMMHAAYNIGLVIILGIESNAGLFNTTFLNGALGMPAEQFTTAASIAVTLTAILTVQIVGKLADRRPVPANCQ